MQEEQVWALWQVANYFAFHYDSDSHYDMLLLILIMIQIVVEASRV